MPPLLRPTVLQYTVSGSLDGQTKSENVPFPPDPAAPIDADGFIAPPPVPVENLGLIDLSRGGGEGQYAGRFVKWIEILGPNVPNREDNVRLAFDDALQQSMLTIPATARGIFSRDCIFVPQTAHLQVVGMDTAASPDPIIVRIAVWPPQTTEGLAAFYEACCCKTDKANDFGQPVFVRGIYTGTTGARTLSSVGPGTAARGVTVAVAIGGTGFDASDVWVMRQVGAQSSPDFPPPVFRILPDLIVFNDPTSADVTFTIPFSAPLGLYDVLVAPDLGGESFSAILADSFTVT